MKYLSVFTLDPSQLSGPPSQERMDKMNALVAEMTADGTLVDTGGRMPTGMSLRVQQHNGKVEITDGPFAESKEIVGGFALLRAHSREHLIEMTRRFLDCAGGGTCTIHEISDGPNDAE